MLQRKDFFSTSAMAMHCREQELRCSTKVMLMSPASRVDFTARNSSNVQPLPPQPVVIASLQTAAAFSRSDSFLIFLMVGKSCALLGAPSTVGSCGCIAFSSVCVAVVVVLRLVCRF